MSTPQNQIPGIGINGSFMQPSGSTGFAWNPFQGGYNAPHPFYTSDVAPASNNQQGMSILQKLGSYFTDPTSGVDRQKVALGAAEGVGSLYSQLRKAHMENEDRKRALASADSVSPQYAALFQNLGRMMQPPPKPPGT